jgi:hypothetical protein
MPAQLHATDFTNPAQPDPTKKNEAHARNSTHTGSGHIVAVNHVDTAPKKPTLIDNAVTLDTSLS